MIRAARLLAVVVPVLGLAALWATSHQTYQQGTEWEVPIEGYDPRDYLRGHYVEFSYDWPGLNQFNDGASGDGSLKALCLEGTAPRVTVARVMFGGETCAHPIRADATGVYGSEALMQGRLYLGQERARQLDDQLRNRDQRGIVTIRQRGDGSFTPISIRFRPLTPAEQAERDGRDAANADPVDISLPEPSGNPPPSPQSAP